MEGDINIGGILRLYDSSSDEVCRNNLKTWSIQAAQSIIYETKTNNQDDEILPNTSLGFTILNDCLRNAITMSRAVQFLPVNNCVDKSCD